MNSKEPAKEAQPTTRIKLGSFICQPTVQLSSWLNSRNQADKFSWSIRKALRLVTVARLVLAPTGLNQARTLQQVTGWRPTVMDQSKLSSRFLTVRHANMLQPQGRESRLLAVNCSIIRHELNSNRPPRNYNSAGQRNVGSETCRRHPAVYL